MPAIDFQFSVGQLCSAVRLVRSAAAFVFVPVEPAVHAYMADPLPEAVRRMVTDAVLAAPSRPKSGALQPLTEFWR
jgi:hypothetical protein